MTKQLLNEGPKLHSGTLPIKTLYIGISGFSLKHQGVSHTFSMSMAFRSLCRVQGIGGWNYEFEKTRPKTQ